MSVETEFSIIAQIEMQRALFYAFRSYIERPSNANSERQEDKIRAFLFDSQHDLSKKAVGALSSNDVLEEYENINYKLVRLISRRNSESLEDLKWRLAMAFYAGLVVKLDRLGIKIDDERIDPDKNKTIDVLELLVKLKNLLRILNINNINLN